MVSRAVGELVREWRTRRRRSQMDLAIEVGVSPRHLSFVETGRSRPSPELVLALADGLDVPLRERNTLLLAAGYAPRFRQRSLDDPADAHVRAVRAADARRPRPVPGCGHRPAVEHACWPTRRAARSLVGLAAGGARTAAQRLPGCACTPTACRRGRPTSTNGPRTCCGQLERSIALTGDPGLAALRDEVRDYPNVAALDRAAAGDVRRAPLLVPLRLDAGGGRALAVHDAHDLRYTARRHPRRARGRAVLPGRRRDRARAARRRSRLALRRRSAGGGCPPGDGAPRARCAPRPTAATGAPARGSCRRACGPTGRRRGGRARG